MRQIGSVLFWTFVVITSILLFPFALIIWLVTAPFGPRKVALHRFTCFWASLYTWFNPWWHVHITGREHIDSHRTYVFVANHLSLLDILVLFRLFRDFKWVSKVEIFKVPVIGWNMRFNGYIPLKRGDRDSVIEMMAACTKTLAQGSSIMMFPEGTRSKTSVMRDFKPGAFELAREAGVAVIPIVIRGSSDALPKSGFVLQGKHQINVTVLPEVPVSEVAAMDTTELTAHVRGLIAAEQDRVAGEATGESATS
ncbi:MAG: lysophospholipid acyltransferase family protein [Candidatus Nanopelagicales bacterium]|nr:1-acyl-sn-glycerol-3-phosphate acyltransferase [Candidatus Nanopelagicales bacterium]